MPMSNIVSDNELNMLQILLTVVGLQTEEYPLDVTSYIPFDTIEGIVLDDSMYIQLLTDDIEMFLSGKHISCWACHYVEELPSTGYLDPPEFNEIELPGEYETFIEAAKEAILWLVRKRMEEALEEFTMGLIPD